MKTILKIIKIFLLLSLTISILLNPNIIIETSLKSFNIWKENIFPTLFIFFVISELLINYGIVEILGEILKPITNTLFKTKGISAFILIMSMISGFPSSAKNIKKLIEKNLINEKEATKLLMFSHFSNPLFIFGTISITFLNNKKTGLLILISHYIGNLIIGLIIRNYAPSIENKNINLEKIKNIKQNKTFGETLTNAIKNSIGILLNILGTITFFLIITSLINNKITLNPILQTIINGLIEMTQGLQSASTLTTSLKIKCILSTFIISFGGISVHMQIISIIQDTKIKYKYFLIARIFHSIISSMITYLLYNLFI